MKRARFVTILTALMLLILPASTLSAQLKLIGSISREVAKFDPPDPPFAPYDPLNSGVSIESIIVGLTGTVLDWFGVNPMGNIYGPGISQWNNYADVINQTIVAQASAVGTVADWSPLIIGDTQYVKDTWHWVAIYELTGHRGQRADVRLDYMHDYTYFNLAIAGRSRATTDVEFSAYIIPAHLTSRYSTIPSRTWPYNITARRPSQDGIPVNRFSLHDGAQYKYLGGFKEATRHKTGTFNIGPMTVGDRLYVYGNLGAYTECMMYNPPTLTVATMFPSFIAALFADSTSLVFPHVANDSNWKTEISIINTSKEKMLRGSLMAYTDSGELVDPVTVFYLLPNARWEGLISDAYPGTDIGYLIFLADSNHVTGYTKFYIDGQCRVALPAVADDVPTANNNYIPHIASDENWWTGISIVNTTPSSKDIVIDFDNGSTVTRTIGPYEHQAFTIRNLFGGMMQPSIHSATVRNCSGMAGLALFGSTEESGNSYLSGILLSNKASFNIYYPHMASDSRWWTGIVAYNPSVISCNLNIFPYRDDGTSLPPKLITLPGKGKYVGTAGNLNFPAGTAWFRLEADIPVTGFQLFGTNDGKQLGGYDCVGIDDTSGIFAKIEKDGWTGIAFVNVEDSPASVNLTAYNNSGDIVSAETISLKPHEKVVGLPSDLFSGDIRGATYIVYSSDRKIAGFQLNGSADNMMLDGLPGL